MVEATGSLSVGQQQKRQRRERLAVAVGLIACALVCAALLVLVTGPLPWANSILTLIFAVIVLNKPRIGLYSLLFCALFLEQWGIAGLDPVTALLPFYQTLSGANILPVPVSPLEILLLLSLAGVVIPRITGKAGPLVRGALFTPVMLFLAFVVASLIYGLVGGGGAGAFDPRAAWEETRAFFYLAAIYFLACNLLKTRSQLLTLMWLFIAAIGFKSAQGIVRFVYVRSNGIQVEAITGHEDVIFFVAFLLLLVGLILFGTRLGTVAKKQVAVMLVVMLPLIFTLLATNRRLGFVVLAVGLGLTGLLLLRTRRDLFFRIVPVVAVGVGLYVALFWNGTGTLSQPIRAVRSIVSPTTQRDRSSNAWRDLENFNIDFNIRSAPITGLGFGRPYTFAVPQPPLDATGFTYWRFIAHDAIYWVWMKMGAVGFILFWNLIGSGAVLGLITFRQLRDGYLRALALVVVGVVLMQAIFSYGDLGLTYSRSMLFLGCMLGVLACLPALESTAAQEGRSPAKRPRFVRLQPKAPARTPV